jgi:EmrB/QacA subfamily drug resistance transporter
VIACAVTREEAYEDRMADRLSDDAAAGHRLKRWTLVAMILCSGIIFLQSTVVNVALPSLGRDLDSGLSGLQWIVDGYILTLAALMIPGGSLGDRYGRRRVMIIGLFGFGTTSMACGLAPTTSWLIGLRILQGVAGALLVPGSLALIRATYDDPEARGEAIGQWAGWSGIVMVIGPLVGGWLVDSLSWRWVFFVVVPLISVAVWLMIRFVPESRSASPPQRLDWLGSLLIILALGGTAFGLIEGPRLGWRQPSVVSALLIGLSSAVVFPFAERRPEPMVPLKIFRSRSFAGANLTTLGVYFALQGATFFVVLYLQNMAGYSAVSAGMVLAPISVLMLVLSPAFGRLVGRYGARLFMTIGPMCCALGLLLFTRLDPEAGLWTEVLPAVIVLGMGLSATVAPLTDTVMSSVAEKYSGIAAAFNNVASRVAGLLAVAGLGVVVTLTFNVALASNIEGSRLDASAADTVMSAVEDPTGAFTAAELPPRVREVAVSAYTVAFRRAMLVSAFMAAAGGVAAAVTVGEGRPDKS